MGGVTINSEHGLVLLSAAAIAFQCLATAAVAGKGRSKYFKKEFLQQHFGEQHKKDFGEEINGGGYPDMGNGKYAEKLSYKEWYEFNNGQRAHYQFIEQLGSVITLLLIAGIGLPTVAGCFGWLYFAGRILFTIGYVRKGPRGRIFGARLLAVSMLGLAVTAFISAGKLYFS